MSTSVEQVHNQNQNAIPTEDLRVADLRGDFTEAPTANKMIIPRWANRPAAKFLTALALFGVESAVSTVAVSAAMQSRSADTSECHTDNGSEMCTYTHSDDAGNTTTTETRDGQVVSTTTSNPDVVAPTAGGIPEAPSAPTQKPSRHNTSTKPTLRLTALHGNHKLRQYNLDSEAARQGCGYTAETAAINDLTGKNISPIFARNWMKGHGGYFTNWRPSLTNPTTPKGLRMFANHNNLTYQTLGTGNAAFEQMKTDAKFNPRFLLHFVRAKSQFNHVVFAHRAHTVKAMIQNNKIMVMDPNNPGNDHAWSPETLKKAGLYRIDELMTNHNFQVKHKVRAGEARLAR